MRYLVAMALVCGCVVADDEMGEIEATLRAGTFPSPTDYPGNGDLAIYEGASTASEDCLIYTTTGTQVQAGIGPSATPIMTVVGDDILDPATGDVVCTRDGNELVERVRSGSDGDGPVLFTVIGRWVFDGDVQLEGLSIPQILAQLDAQLLYTFQGPHVYEHAAYDGDILVTATAPLTLANKTRKLVIASLIAGECGGLGLYADEEGDPNH